MPAAAPSDAPAIVTCGPRRSTIGPSTAPMNRPTPMMEPIHERLLAATPKSCASTTMIAPTPAT